MKSTAKKTSKKTQAKKTSKKTSTVKTATVTVPNEVAEVKPYRFPKDTTFSIRLVTQKSMEYKTQIMILDGYGLEEIQDTFRQHFKGKGKTDLFILKRAKKYHRQEQNHIKVGRVIADRIPKKKRAELLAKIKPAPAPKKAEKKAAPKKAEKKAEKKVILKKAEKKAAPKKKETKK